MTLHFLKECLDRVRHHKRWLNGPPNKRRKRESDCVQILSVKLHRTDFCGVSDFREGHYGEEAPPVVVRRYVRAQKPSMDRPESSNFTLKVPPPKTIVTRSESLANRNSYPQMKKSPAPSNHSFLEPPKDKAGPFRATQLWNDIVSHLRCEVEVKRRRLKMRRYEACFTGTDAVDTVLERLCTERGNFTKEVSRDKATKLCQVLMEHHVFEPVSGDGKSLFDDSPNKYYRFLEDKENQEPESMTSDLGECSHHANSLHNDMRLGSGELDSGCEDDDGSFGKHGQIVQEIMDITGAWKRYSSECLRKLTPAKLFSRRPSLPETMAHLTGRKEVSPAVEEEVCREVVLSRLLTLVDLPILDTILSYESNPASKQKQNLAFSNPAFRKQESASSIFSERSGDAWLEAAADCTEYHPRGTDLMELAFSGTTSRCTRLQLYTAITEHYRDLSSPLWSDKFTDLHVALLNLLMQGRRDVVLQALQLAMVLLSRHIREELHRLLRFMKRAAEEDAVRLSDTEMNRQQVELSFTSAIIRNHLLAPQQAGQLVMFMMDHEATIFTMPDDVEEAVTLRLQTIITGMHMPTLETTFCQRVTDEEWRKQQTDTTNQAVIELMNSILDSTTLPLKEKKQRLKQFQKHHPELYKKHFQGLH